VLDIFIGYDSREDVAFRTLEHSIEKRSSVPVSIVPVKLKEVRAQGLYTRARGPTESTEFSLTRFLVPALSKYRGWSVFMDCDMLCRADIAGLAAQMQKQSDKALLVCKHEYTPSPERKFLNQIQTAYPRKNWSSLMVLNNQRCAALTPEYVNSASGLQLHRFEWIADDLIGGLPLEWNWLVTEYQYNPEAKLAHFTRGGPWFAEYGDCDYAGEWRAERDSMASTTGGKPQ
jgi:hypothetical protein